MKRETLKAIAQKLCDIQRRTSPARRFFIGDPPCKECIEKARKLREVIRERLKQHARLFRRGDVVIHPDDPSCRGVVTAGGLGLTVAWQHGGRSTGAGMLFLVRRMEPRRILTIPQGALSNKGWVREQAVTAALRRAGIEVKR